MGRRGEGVGREDRLSYLQELAAFACRTRLADLPAKVLERTRWVVADSLPVIAAGMQQPEMQALLKHHSLSRGNAWVLGTRKRADALDAALLNGTAGTWLELNEGNLFAKGHPGNPGGAGGGGAGAGVGRLGRSAADGDRRRLRSELAHQPRGADEDRGPPARHLGHARRRGGGRPAERLRRAPHARVDQRRDDDGHGDQPADAARRRDGAQHLHRAFRATWA